MADRWIMDPDETKIFKFDYAPLANASGDSNWLDRTSSPVESISSQTTVSIDSPGITVVSSSITDSNTTVTVTLSASNCTAGSKYRVRNRITTSNSQVKDKTVTVHIVSQ